MTALRRLALGISFSLFAVSTAHAASWASVNFNGTLDKSKGVLANYHPQIGFYQVIFRRNVEKCVPMVTMRDFSAEYSVLIAGSPGEVRVFVSSGGSYVDASFYIALIC
jgi:hypothetical protein